VALRTLHRIELGDRRITEVIARGALRIAQHAHPLAHLTIIRSGMIIDRSGGAEEVLQSGDVLFRPAGTTHENTVPEPGSRGVVIELSDAFLSPFRVNRDSMHLSNESLRRTPQELLAQLATTDAVAPLLIRALITEILAHAVRAAAGMPSEPPPEWMLRVIEEIDARYAEPLSLERAAAAAGVSGVRVRHALRKHYGRTFAEMLRERRISAALALLEAGIPLGDIAPECGFYDQSHFTRAFIAVRGMTPRTYRSRVR